jgi:hypothetical protein
VVLREKIFRKLEDEWLRVYMEVMEPIEIISKNCTRCKNNKPLEQFGKDTRHKDGHQSHCYTCRNEAGKIKRSTPEGKAAKKLMDQTYRQGNLEKCIATRQIRIKEGIAIINSYRCHPCTDCGRTFDPHCMELDHIRGEKSKNVSAMRAHNREKLIQEIEKCEVVCAVCHRIRTEKRREPTKEKRLQAHRDQVNEFKSKPCTDCGEIFPPVGVDLDHVKGEKIFEISNMGHYPRWKVVEELEKCEVVCACCHRIRTKTRMISQT